MLWKRIARTAAVAVCAAALVAGCEDTPQPAGPDAQMKHGQSKGKAAPGSCDVTVPDDQPDIGSAIGAASAGETVCLRPGTYAEDVVVDEAVTLQGRTPATSGNPATVDGSVEVTADGATVRRIRVAPSGLLLPDPFHPRGILVVASDVVIEENLVEGMTGSASQTTGSYSMNGIQVYGSTPARTNIVVRNNVVRGFRHDGTNTYPDFGGVAGIKIQENLDGVVVTGNTVEDLHSAGWAWGIVLTPDQDGDIPVNVTVTDNTVGPDLNDGSVTFGPGTPFFPGSGFGIDASGGDFADASEVTLRYNNLLAPNGAESKDPDHTLDADCNWWGDRSGPTHAGNPGGTGTIALERSGATIEYTPWLNANAPSKACNGGVKGKGKAGGGH